MEKTRVAIAGGFDPLHSGHIDHIRKASTLGDLLIVIIARDDQLIKKKGYCFLPLAERMEILKSIKGVNEVIMNRDEGLDCSKTLETIRPDIFAKGGDRVSSNMPSSELEVCQRINCRVVYNIGEHLNSSQEIVNKAISAILNMGN